MMRRLSNLWTITGREVRSLRSLIPGFFGLVLACMFLIGGCNNSGSGQVDGRTIGGIEGVVVPALRDELTLIRWREGAPDGDLYLNGSRVATLSQAEEQAVRDAYKMGFFVALIDADTDDILALHEVLGLNPIFADDAEVDLIAFAREFNVSGIRYHMLYPHINEDGNPIEPDQNRNRVLALIEWASENLSSTAQRGVGDSPTNELTMLADSLTFTQVFSFTPPSISGFGVGDFRAQITITAEAISAHSVENNLDFYYLQSNYQLTPSSTLSTDFSKCNCTLGTPTCMEQFKGVQEYEPNSQTRDFTSTTGLVNILNQPPTTIDEETTSSTVSHTIGGEASYSSEDGAGVGVTDDVSYDRSQSFSSPTVKTTNLNNTEAVFLNNALWKFFIEGSRVMTSNFTPQVGWIWEGDPSTRANGFIELVQDISWTYFPFTCSEIFVKPGAVLTHVNKIPVPPLPPPAKQCSTDADCPVAQVCATDLSPPVCVPQACDESMTCPAGFNCVNEVCEPIS